MDGLKMAGIEKFDDLVAWQKARALTRLVYEATRRQRFWIIGTNAAGSSFRHV
jgi:hypothetical protein